ncbi:MAG: trkA2 [Myxococcaceae bacterium]|nr:trkA2 [Myxococcaceae bacterium]
MRVIIAGAGRAGVSVAVHLRKGGHDVVVIDRDAEMTRRAFEEFGLVSLHGDASEPSMLQAADVSITDVVVTLLRRDADNLAVALLARHAGAKRVMVRMRDTAYREVYAAAGVSRIVSEIDIFVGALATAIEHESVRHSMILGRGESVAFELSVPVNTWIAGSTISEIDEHPEFPTSCVFAGLVEESGVVHAPRGSSVVTGGMTVVLVARKDELAQVIAFFMRTK